MSDNFQSHVGQSVILLELNNEREVTLVRVGRTNGYFEQYGREVAFDLRTGFVKGDRGGTHRVFTPQGLVRHRERAELRVELAGRTSWPSWIDRLTDDELKTVLDIVRICESRPVDR